MNLLLELPRRLRRVTEGGMYRPEIDGLRFLAILPVVMWHMIQRVSRAQPSLSPTEAAAMLWVPDGWNGVVLFFVISGFIISSQFIRRRKVGARVNLGSYFYRRITRIEPPYLLLLTGSYLLFSLTPFRPENAISFWRGSETFTQSYLASITYLHGIIFDSAPRLFPGGWSLEIEIQFYVLAPIIFALLYLEKRLLPRIIFGMAVLIIALVVSHWIEVTFGARSRYSLTIIRYFFYFWLGALIAEIEAEQVWPRFPTQVWDLLGFSGAAAYLWTGVAQHSSWGVDSLIIDIIGITAFLLMFGGAMKGGWFRNLCSHPWISLIGGACYSIYLSHVQLIQVLSPLVAHVFHPASLMEASVLAVMIQLPTVLAVGLLLYAFIERPFMTPHWPERLVNWMRSGSLERHIAQLRR